MSPRSSRGRAAGAPGHHEPPPPPPSPPPTDPPVSPPPELADDGGVLDADMADDKARVAITGSYMNGGTLPDGTAVDAVMALDQQSISPSATAQAM